MSIVTPGECITSDQSYMRGHGTFFYGSALYSSQGGIVHRVNKLISVRSLRARYCGDIGDVIIGRVIEIGAKRWKVDTNSRQDSALLLSSIQLPGAIQRRKSESDELQMRSFFAEGDILCAEVQSVFADGGLGIHTRNLRYGKLTTGELVKVQSALIRRAKSHFIELEWGVEVILGMNGYIWVGSIRKTPDQQNLDELYSSNVENITKSIRIAISKTRNAILALNNESQVIEEASIFKKYKEMIAMTSS